MRLYLVGQRRAERECSGGAPSRGRCGSQCSVKRFVSTPGTWFPEQAEPRWPGSDVFNRQVLSRRNRAAIAAFAGSLLRHLAKSSLFQRRRRSSSAMILSSLATAVRPDNQRDISICFGLILSRFGASSESAVSVSQGSKGEFFRGRMANLASVRLRITSPTPWRRNSCRALRATLPARSGSATQQ